jgi:hypothetical protein
MKMSARFVERYPLTTSAYRELEGFNEVTPGEKQSWRVHGVSSWKNRLQSWMERLTYTLSGRREVSITLKQKGQAQYWQVYDPHTQRSMIFVTEEDVRVWLDQRYSF